MSKKFNRHLANKHLDYVARLVSSPDPLCPRCGLQVCEHNGKKQELDAWLKAHPSPRERR